MGAGHRWQQVAALAAALALVGSGLGCEPQGAGRAGAPATGAGAPTVAARGSVAGPTGGAVGGSLGGAPADAAASPAGGQPWSGLVSPPPPLTAAAAILMDWQTGQVLYEKNAYVRRPPASTTKVLTALIALERGRLDDRVRVSERAARTPGSSMYIRAGEEYTLRDLLYGMLLNSGNDAAVAVAEHIAGSVERFVDLMNQRARELGARNTHFSDPHGLGKSGPHYSTAYDLALITRHALTNPVFAAMVRQREMEVQVGERVLALRNTNRLLWMHAGTVDGVKTGTTSAAGACLISSATRGEAAAGESHKLVAVVLDADNRWNDSIRLLEWGFANFRLARVAVAGDVLARVPVAGGQDRWVPAVAAGDVAVVVPRRLQVSPAAALALPGAVAAPVAAGQPLGQAVASAGGWSGPPVPLVAGAAVPPATPLTTWVRLVGAGLDAAARWRAIP